jgi:hypothetical protein
MSGIKKELERLRMGNTSVWANGGSVWIRICIRCIEVESQATGP